MSCPTRSSKILPAQILLLTFCFAHKFSYSQTAVACTIGDHLVSENTISDWFSYCGEVCVLSNEQKYANRGKVGGPNHIVQVRRMQDLETEISEGELLSATGFWG